ncbi:MAG: hypothetical protein ACJ718_00935, partial [Nitrososphaeraceae archaeon]
MALIQTSKIKTIAITLISLQFLLLASILIVPVFGNGLSDYNNNNKSINENVKSLSKTEFFSNNNTMTTAVPFTNQSTLPAVKTNDVKRHFYNNTDGIILASTNYYNVTDLDHN